jgi:hypothetical protein
LLYESVERWLYVLKLGLQGKAALVLFAKSSLASLSLLYPCLFLA